MPHLQELFDRVARHLLRQKEPSIDRDDICAYRYERGSGEILSCAVGCLIDDKHYYPDLEHQLIESAPVRRAVEQSLGFALEKRELQLLEVLQYVHDSTHPQTFNETIIERLADTAKEFSLEWKGAAALEGQL